MQGRQFVVAFASGGAVALLLGVQFGQAGELTARPPAVRIVFERDIQPLLAKCLQCHGPGKARAGLRLDRRYGALAELESGNHAVVPGHPERSELLRRVSALELDQRMPPKGARLSPASIAHLHRWITEGAPWPEHWAYRPLVKPTLPPKLPQNWPRTPIDQFILARLLARGFAPAPPADRRSLLRRVYFDLIGLPPTPEEIDAFLIDSAPDAYEKLVDRLLASPRYGERWARHWMDTVHYAESHGQDQDRPREHAWPYRDYLIRTFNADKPYARFVQEQVAGDGLFADDPEAIEATGFLATGPWDESSLRDIREDSIDREIGRNLDRDDIVTTVMATFTSTTVHCARCHDHKFDPISQREYYGLQAVFAGIDKADRSYDLEPRVAARRRELTRRWALLAEQATALNLAVRIAVGRALDRKLSALPRPRLVYCGTNQFQPDGSFRPTSLPRPIHILKRGDVRHPGALARPGALSCIPALQVHFRLDRPNDEGSRRAALARWLTDRRNGLVWRSIANRVWQHHFGRGLVDTPNDFGHMGAAPTHPELLDWLAVTLQENGGSLKTLHRLIVTSAVYRQSTRYWPAYAERDADNHYLWRMNRRRLDAESLHDAVLFISGKLDAKMGGPSVKQFLLTPGVHVTPNVDYTNFNVDDPANYRRGVYRFVFRTLPDPFMEALDCPDGSRLAPVRQASVTALQALALLNDKFMLRQAEHIASRAAAAGPVVAQRVRRAYRLILGRAPTSQELKAVSTYAARHGLANACRVLLNSSEFVFLN